MAQQKENGTVTSSEEKTKLSWHKTGHPGPRKNYRSPMGAGLGWKDGEGAVDGTKSESYVPCHLPRAQALSVSLSSNDM